MKFRMKIESEQSGKQRVLVCNDEKGYEEERDDPVGQPWYIKRQPICLAKPDPTDKEKRVPYDPLKEWRESDRMKKADSPESLYDALKFREVAPVYRIPPSLMEKLNTWLIIGIFGILCFFTFLIYSSNTGG